MTYSEENLRAHVMPSEMRMLLVAGAFLIVTATPCTASARIGERTVVEKVHDGALAAARDDLHALRELETNWHGPGIEAPTEVAIVLGEKVLQAIFDAGLRPDRIEASVEGGLSISFIRGQKYADFECFNDGELLASMSNRSAKPKVWQVASGDLSGAATEIRSFLDA